jgi:nucleotidyltransferase/DNA polymerase involved in DNA repair
MTLREETGVLITGHADNPVYNVLSNNDGCAVSLSPEAKALGITLGVPWFQLAPRAREWGLVQKSSNYELYADISRRVMDHFPAQRVDRDLLDR